MTSSRASPAKFNVSFDVSAGEHLMSVSMVSPGRITRGSFAFFIKGINAYVSRGLVRPKRTPLSLNVLV